jgi:hypothetical protein
VCKWPGIGSSSVGETSGVIGLRCLGKVAAHGPDVHSPTTPALAPRFYASDAELHRLFKSVNGLVFAVRGRWVGCVRAPWLRLKRLGKRGLRGIGLKQPDAVLTPYRATLGASCAQPPRSACTRSRRLDHPAPLTGRPDVALAGLTLRHCGPQALQLGDPGQ